jgi:hypothetical protein
MGRGRAKAKQQKVARELKYNSHHTDLDALQRELRSSSSYATDTIEFGGEDLDDDSDAYAGGDAGRGFAEDEDDPGEWPGSARAR